MLVPKLRFKDESGKEYPEWQQKKIDDVVQFVRNGFSYKWDLNRNHTFKVTRIESISTGKINPKKLGSVESIDEKYKLKDGDILFSHINSLPYIGNTAIYHDNLGVIYHGMNLLNIRVNEKALNSFLQYVFKTSSFLNIIKRNAQQAVNQCSISTTTIKKLPIHIPSLPEQEKIADFLATYDRMINVQSQRVEAMKTRKKGLLQKIFSQEIRFKDDQGKDYPVWEKKRLMDCCIINPSSPKLPNKFIYIDLESVKSGRLLNTKVIQASEAPSRAQREVLKNDILYQTVRPYQKNNFWVKTLENLPTIASTGYSILRCNENIAGYIYYVVQNSKFLKVVLNRCTGGTYPAITGSELGKINIPLPSLPEQQKMADFMTAMDAQIEVEEKRLETMKIIKKGLLQQMFI